MGDYPPTRSASVLEDLADLGARQCGVVSRIQLAARGSGSDVVRTHVRARRWRILGEAVVLDRGPLRRDQRWWVAVFATRSRGALCGFTALEVAGLRGWAREDLHVVVPRGWRVCALPDLVVHESRRFAFDRDVVGAGVPRTSVGRAAIDAAAWSASKGTAVGLLAAVVQQGLCRPSDLSAAIAAAGGIRHRRVLNAALIDIAGGSQSLAEVSMARLVRRAGLGARVAAPHT